MQSTWTLPGLHWDSTQNSVGFGFQPVLLDSSWTPLESNQSDWSPQGQVGECKVLGMCSCVVFTMNVCDVIVEVCHVHWPSHLSTWHLLLWLEVLKSLVVGEVLKMGTEEVWFPFLQCIDDGEEFFLMNRVVFLCIIELVGVIGNWSGGFPCSTKTQYGAGAVVTGISGEVDVGCHVFVIDYGDSQH
jgi:hypothetical protein